jgi:hypothetical protein
MAQNDTPPQPVVQSLNMARFLSWLMKKGGMHNLKRCERKWEREGINIEGSIRELDRSVITIETSRGEKVVRLNDWAWADQWVSYYGQKIPHHRQIQRLEK